MREQIYPIAAIFAGACIAFAVLVVGDRAQSINPMAWFERARNPQDDLGSESPGPWSKALVGTGLHTRLADLVDRAGWKESPERLSAFAVGLSVCLAVIGGASGSMLGPPGALVLAAITFSGGLGLCSLALRTAIDSRRRRLAAELIPLLELFTLELSGGGSALGALGTVSTRLQGELASDVRRLLIASQVVGSSPFEARLMRYSERLDISAIASLAAILASSREYGTGALQGVRALATDLRHAQRRELIAQSRRALNHVLLPAGVGVLLPFLAVVMFPAVTALQRNLH